MPDKEIYEAMEDWLQINREAGVDVPALFEQFARDALRVVARRKPLPDGRLRKMSIYPIVERVRWQVDYEIANDIEGFRIRNDYKPILVRILCRRIPSLKQHLIVKTLKRGEPTDEQLARLDPR